MPSIYYYCLCNSPIVLVSNPPLVEGYVLLTLHPSPGRSLTGLNVRPNYCKLLHSNQTISRIGLGA